jgi:ABC-type phosphate transport system ATPase subunit
MMGVESDKTKEVDNLIRERRWIGGRKIEYVIGETNEDYTIMEVTNMTQLYRLIYYS